MFKYLKKRLLRFLNSILNMDEDLSDSGGKASKPLAELNP